MDSLSTSREIIMQILLFPESYIVSFSRNPSVFTFLKLFLILAAVVLVLGALCISLYNFFVRNSHQHEKKAEEKFETLSVSRRTARSSP
jgi:Na+-driven multidrug efflux pump